MYSCSCVSIRHFILKSSAFLFTEREGNYIVYMFFFFFFDMGNILLHESYCMQHYLNSTSLFM